MFTGLVSSPRVCLGSLTNTQGLPLHRLTYIAFAELKSAYSCSEYNTAGVENEYRNGTCFYSFYWN